MDSRRFFGLPPKLEADSLVAEDHDVVTVDPAYPKLLMIGVPGQTVCLPHGPHCPAATGLVEEA